MKSFHALIITGLDTATATNLPSRSFCRTKECRATAFSVSAGLLWPFASAFHLGLIGWKHLF